MKLYLPIIMFCVLSLGCYQRGEEVSSIAPQKNSALETRLENDDPNDGLSEPQVELEFFSDAELNDLSARYKKAICELNEFELRRSTAVKQELELKQKLEALRGPKLADLTTVDETIRDFGKIQIRGSALSDAHVAAIIKLTESFTESRLHSESDLIIHDGHNKCHRIWQLRGGGSFAINLELIDGRWETGSMTSIIACQFPDD